MMNKQRMVHPEHAHEAHSSKQPALQSRFRRDSRCMHLSSSMYSTAPLVQNWLGTCGNDGVIADTKLPCVENFILVGALCLPVFLVVQFDTGIFYQVVVFAYGCMNGLVNLGLGQVVTWNDLVKQFERGMLLPMSIVC
jgi:hypothetical protein